MCGLSSLVKTVINHKKLCHCNPHTCTQYHHHTETPVKKGSSPLLPKKAVFLSCQKRQSSSPAKKGSLLQEEDEEEEEAEKRSRKKKQKKNKINKMIIINDVDPPELLPRVNHLADPGIWKTTTTKNKGGNQIGLQERVWRLFTKFPTVYDKV